MKRIKIGLLLAFVFTLNIYSQMSYTISLAQWSVHKSVQQGKLTTLEFPGYARKEFNIGAVEYVSTLFGPSGAIEDSAYLKQLNAECAKYKVASNLIMIDGEGNLGDTSVVKRDLAVKNHYKWVRGAKALGCKSIRVNAAGEGTPQEVQQAAIDGLSKLCEYAKQFDINIIVENHWGYSSNPDWLMTTLNSVKNDNIGTLPDFGNFDAELRYEGVRKMLPMAKGVSAKAFNFNDEGKETQIDYVKMMNLVKESGFNGYIGIEYEGETLSEKAGIEATIKLLNSSF